MIASVVPALLMGLLGGVHCVAMCGGASAALCAGAPRSGLLGVAWSGGRVIGYSLLGAVAGALGALPSGGPLDAVRFGLRAMAALCMLGVGLHLFGLPSFVGRLEAAGGPLWRRVAPLARRLVPLRSVPSALAAGALWALLPCGLIYGALALAATAGSTLGGAATMAAFAAGTLPIMLTVTTVARSIAKAFDRFAVRRLAGAVVLALGLWNTVGIARQVGEPTHTCCHHR